MNKERILKLADVVAFLYDAKVMRPFYDVEPDFKFTQPHNHNGLNGFSKYGNVTDESGEVVWNVEKVDG